MFYCSVLHFFRRLAKGLNIGFEYTEFVYAINRN